MSKKAIARFAPVLVVLALVLVVVSVAPVAEAGRRGNAKGRTISASSYSFSMRIDKQFHTFSAVDNAWPVDYDTFTVECRDTMRLYIKIRDCCLTGDTVCWIHPNGTKQVCRTSPKPVVKYMRCQAGAVKTFYVAYQSVGRGGYPAGYDIWVVGLPK